MPGDVFNEPEKILCSIQKYQDHLGFLSVLAMSGYWFMLKI